MADGATDLLFFFLFILFCIFAFIALKAFFYDSDVTLIVENNQCKPYFMEKVKVAFEKGRNLLYYLQEAAHKNKSFEYNAVTDSRLGYIIVMINGVAIEAENSKFWIIEDENGRKIEHVRDYFPKERETIRFNYVKRSLLRQVLTYIVSVPVKFVKYAFEYYYKGGSSDDTYRQMAHDMV
ncbi:uncharacterized protein LOC131930135 [Physella acuta]|uniref:uncharacterized protein LOC131930135 n=1 Tax=Physella acuta TaxID=109671 RepID=UPI0027DE4173|nr:uncharacterized protein LOC131930135 [Physella acuta]XP_059142509.1 uncharacterized protein LOC131930135 [Physella acuta]XP_059142510.1 uncharacterized protein LOC131930135 [Physella acuta]